MGPAAELITDREGLRALEPAWRELAERGGSAFLTPEWMRCWLGQYGGEAEPLVAAVRRPDGSLLGLVPFVLDRSRRPRAIRLAGANVGDRFHPVALEPDRAEVAAAAVGALCDQGGWNVAVLDNVDQGIDWTRRPPGTGGPRLAAASSPPRTLPFIAIGERGWDDWEAYLSSRSRNLRSQLRRRERKLAHDHAMLVRLTSEPDRVEADMATFFHLHDARWRERAGSSSSGGRARAFHREFAGVAQDLGWLRLWIMELEGRPAAAWYGWRVGERYSYYLAGFDPTWSRLGVGQVLLAHTIRAAIEEGATEYDMLLGDEPYKARFADERRFVQSVALTPRLHPLRAVVSLEMAARRVARRLPADSSLRRAGGRLAGALPSGRRR